MCESVGVDREGRLAADELAKQFWTLGNLIAGFCVLQELAFLAVTYAAGTEAHTRALSAPYLILVSVAFGSAVFAGAVWYCGSKEAALRLAAGHPPIVISSSRHATVGRIICITACYCVVVLRVLHHIL
jgi:hypothetical protein